MKNSHFEVKYSHFETKNWPKNAIFIQKFCFWLPKLPNLGQKVPEMSILGLKRGILGPKWPKMVKNDQKWSKMAEIDPKRPKKCISRPKIPNPRIKMPQNLFFVLKMPFLGVERVSLG